MIKWIVGDCVDVMADMMSESVDLTITSPPYDKLRDYEDYIFDFENIAKQLFRITKQGGVVVWVVADATVDGGETGTSFRQALYFKEIGFRLFDTMIYTKDPKGAVGTSKNRYFQCFEYMFVFSKGKPKTANLIRDRKNKKKNEQTKRWRTPDGRLCKKSISVNQPYSKRTNLWHFGIGKNKSTKDVIAHEHPAIFPEKLAEDHILSWSNENDLVFDPMCGSGTVGKMALKHNRNFIGCDVSEKYIDIAKTRLTSLSNMCKKEVQHGNRND